MTMAEKNKNNYKVLITTSGLGQRLGDITKYTNKSLVRVGKKPALSYIIESYPKNIELVITIGHFGNQVKDFVKLVYPDRKITFVNVKKYQGLGSSLGYSMLQAKKELNCPFIFHAGDTIVKDRIPSPEKNNWVGGFRKGGTAAYSSFNAANGRVQFINGKGALEFDYLHIGLVGIKDYQDFWNRLEYLYKKNPKDSTLNDCAVINLMLKNGKQFLVKEFKTWYDIGNTESISHARKNISDAFSNLNKVDESIFIFDNFVVKFFYDSKIVEQRVERAKLLKGLVPEIEKVAGNFYRYRYVKGDLYSRVVNPNNFSEFLKWADAYLWKQKKEIDNRKFKTACYNFYYEKSKQRIKKFLDSSSVEDREDIINGEKVPSIKEILNKLDFNWLSNGDQRQIHGDFILDNIIKTSKGYCLLDWRQNFGGLLEVGDVYYDFAKLNHNLIVNHDIVNSDLFSIKITGKSVTCDILRKDNLVSCQDVLFRFLNKKGYNINKVKILTSLVWLNMSPLHHHPFNLFLYYFGKLNLWRAIKESK